MTTNNHNFCLLRNQRLLYNVHLFCGNSEHATGTVAVNLERGREGGDTTIYRLGLTI